MVKDKHLTSREVKNMTDRGKLDTPHLPWHLQSLPRLQVSFCYVGGYDEAWGLTLRAKAALNSPLGQVILVKIWHLSHSHFHWFPLLNCHDAGHPWRHLFCLALVSVNWIQAPCHWTIWFQRIGADKQHIKQGRQTSQMEHNAGSIIP